MADIATGWIDWGRTAYADTQDYGPSSLSLEPAGHGLPHWHEGIDLGTPEGKPVTSPVAGLIEFAGTMPGWGNWIVENIGGGVDITLIHLKDEFVHAGQVVAPGTELGITGNTGVSTGPHTLLVAQKAPPGGGLPVYGSDVNPAPYLFSPSEAQPGVSDLIGPKSFGPVPNPAYGWSAPNIPGLPSSNAAGSWLHGIFESIKGGLTRAGFILFGLVLVIIGILIFTRNEESITEGARGATEALAE